MNRAIQKHFGRHIDLDKIITISDALFIDKMGSGGFFILVTIEAQLRDQPLEFWLPCSTVWKHDADFAEQQAMNDRQFLHDGPFPRRLPDGRIKSQVEVQEKVDALVTSWKSLNEVWPIDRPFPAQHPDIDG